MIIFLGRNHDLYKKIIEQSRNDMDIVVSCQYPYKVPPSLIKSHTCVNIHYGLLPQHAGMNPVYWQIKDGGSFGVTLHYMDDNFDSGDIIDRWEAPSGNVTADEAFRFCEEKGKDLFTLWYKKVVDGTAPRVAQDKSLRKYKHKNDVNFSQNVIADLSFVDKDIRSLTFKGKQYARIRSCNRLYDLVPAT
jgi:methionyl-tRNA formyltransferase